MVFEGLTEADVGVVNGGGTFLEFDNWDGLVAELLVLVGDFGDLDDVGRGDFTEYFSD